MVTDIELEHLYRRVHLVRGAGNREHSELCIMSLVALLSGQEHSDAPSGVSTVVRRFAISINDRMPDHLRQRLKPFAPRLLGTMDGHDDKRVDLLLAAVHHEILPRAVVDHLGNGEISWSLSQQNRRWQAISAFRHPKAWFSRVIDKPLWPHDPLGPDNVSAATAQLLARCAKMTGNGGSEWYWLRAIDLLDRICNVTGDDQVSRRLASVSSADALASFQQNSSLQHDKSWPGTVLNRLRVMVPGLLV